MTTLNYKKGDATRPVSNGNIVIPHIVNDIGAWGSGFVMAISKRWPGLRQEYLKWHNREIKDPPFGLGETQFIEAEPTITVANMCAQHSVGSAIGPPIRYDAVRKCMEAVTVFCKKKNASAHMPFIGCGLAGGKWEEIEKIVQETLIAGKVNVTVYDYAGEFATLVNK